MNDDELLLLLAVMRRLMNFLDVHLNSYRNASTKELKFEMVCVYLIREIMKWPWVDIRELEICKLLLPLLPSLLDYKMKDNMAEQLAVSNLTVDTCTDSDLMERQDVREQKLEVVESVMKV